MEFCEGSDLNKLINEYKKRNEPIKEELIYNIVLQICGGIKVIHKHNLIHRDLKPSNIMRNNDRIKIGDFGISKKLDTKSGYAKTSVGTFNYMAPEILKGEKYNSKVDIWALGCIIYELLTFNICFENEGLYGLFNIIINEQHGTINLDEYNHKWQELIDLLLNKNYKKRPDINEVYNFLKKEIFHEMNKKAVKKDIILYYNQKYGKNSSNGFAINKNWIENWKQKINFEKNKQKLEKNFVNSINIIEVPDEINDLFQINNKEIIVNIDYFLNDGNELNIENKILKENSYEIISEELWESFKKYGYDIEINYEIINNSMKNFLTNLVFLKNDKNRKIILKFDCLIYLDDEKNLINKIVRCLNSKINNIAKNICLFYSNKEKYENDDFIYNKISDKRKYIISFIKKINLDNDKISLRSPLYLPLQSPILTGLTNSGEDSYINSVLQILNNINLFSQYLCQISISKQESPIISALKNVFLNMRNPNIKTYNPLELKTIISKYNPKLLQNESINPLQLFEFIFNSIHKELNENKNEIYPFDDEVEDTNWNEKYNYEKNRFNYENKSIIIDLFYGIQATETFCLNCNKICYIFEHFYFLTLPVLLKNDIIDLKDMINDYSKTSKIKSDYFCSICDKKNNAYYKNIFYEIPEILIIHPEGLKDNHINFEEKNDIKLSENLKNKIIVYNLIGIIYHFEKDNRSHNIAHYNI